MEQVFWQTNGLALQFEDNIALVSSHQEITYRALHQQVITAKATILQLLGDTSSNKQLVMLVAKNTIESVVYYLALLQLKHVVWWLDKDLSEDKKQQLIKYYQVNLLINDGEITCLNNFQHNLHEDLALLNTTSGSTGSPSLVRLSYENLNSNCQAICQTLLIKPTDTVQTTLPLHYSFGLSILNTHLNSGTEIILNNHSLMSKEFWVDFKQYQVKCLYGVPFIFDMLLKLNLKRLALNSLRFLAVAGGKLLPEKVTAINQWCIENNKLFFVMYGQTEATARISVLAPEKVSTKPYSIGQAISGGNLSLHPIDKNSAELCYRGKNVMMGNANNKEDLALPSSNNGLDLLHTGDIAECDQDGDYHIVGRLKRFIKITGQRINLDEIQMYFASKNITLICSGEDDLLKCYVVKESGNEQENIVESKVENTAAYYRQLICQYLQIHSSYCQCFLIDEIPYLSSGKINYPKLNTITEVTNKVTKDSK